MPSEPRLRVFGIGATAFSGTTLLSFILGAHRRIFATSEAYQLFHRYRAMVGKSRTLETCSVHQKDCDFWTKDFSERCEQGDISDLYRRIEDYSDETNHVVHSFIPEAYQELLREKTPFNGFIVLFKRPISFHSSRKQHEGSSVQDTAAKYVARYRHILTLAEDHRLPMTAVFYEDLATKPEATLKALCAWMGLTYDPVMTTPWEAMDRLHTIGGNTGTYMHLWDEARQERMLASPYWQDVYGERGRRWLVESYRNIRLDERWKTLPPDEIREMEACGAAQEMFENLMARRMVSEMV